MKKERIGIFGGTFNPPHKGHIAAADQFIKQMNLDRLIVVPAFLPPHKEYRSDVSCESRLEMCKLAFSDLNNTTVSDMEIKRGGTSYTYITLEELYSDKCELFLLCGTDMILSLDTWKNPDIIFKFASICYVRRECNDTLTSEIEKKCKVYQEKFNASIYAITVGVIEISSSDIRNNIASCKEYLPGSVADYIDMRGLYK